jgi:flagellar assembly factor FliW
MSTTSTETIRPPQPGAGHLYFKAGIPGFPRANSFSLRKWGEEPTPFRVLESQDIVGLCFVTVDPAVFFPWYEPQFGAEVYQALDVDHELDVNLDVNVNVEGGGATATASRGATTAVAATAGGATAGAATAAGAATGGDHHDLTLLVILTLHSRPEQTTANLLGPIVLNPDTGRAVQAVLSGSGFDPQTPVTKKP